MLLLRAIGEFRYAVFKVQDSKATKVPVKTGFNDGILAEIVEGLQPADAIIIAGKQSVSEGQAVEATETR